mmetsp:Transcript_91504/g.144574  ORF Transcript_91504/g.144574 Transcript_91504/m.144574 type:complete len:441 (+) Transcript_91504:1-1323(+)
MSLALLLLSSCLHYRIRAMSDAHLTRQWEDGGRDVEIDGHGALLRRQLAGLSALTVGGASEDNPDQKEGLGLIALLVNSSDPVEMYHLEMDLVPSLVRFLKFRTPVSILFSGPYDPAEDATIKLRLNPKISLSLVDVTLRVEQFAKDHIANTASRRRNWKLSEFWAMHVHLLPELQHYRYVWHLAPGSSLMADVTTNLYEVMQQHHAAVGYRLLKTSKPEACSGIQSTVRKFFEANKQWAPKTLQKRAFLEMYEEAKCPLWSNDFEIVDLDYLRGNEAYSAYVSYLANEGGFAKHGWGEHIVQTVFVGTQENPERMLCMTPWVYDFRGKSNMSCGDGMVLANLFENSAKEYLEKPAKKKKEAPVEALQIEEVPHHSKDMPQEIKEVIRAESTAKKEDPNGMVTFSTTRIVVAVILCSLALMFAARKFDWSLPTSKGDITS